MDKIIKTEEEWKLELPPEVYKIVRKGGTEAPFTGEYVHTEAKGIYKCYTCGLELFSSETKFDSGSGWPSFDRPENTENVELIPDESLGMIRTEVKCRRCGAHLGHVFDDGPTDTQQRFCINSCALKLEIE